MLKNESPYTAYSRNLEKLLKNATSVTFPVHNFFLYNWPKFTFQGNVCISQTTSFVGGLSVNPSKTQLVLFTTKTNTPDFRLPK